MQVQLEACQNRFTKWACSASIEHPLAVLVRCTKAKYVHSMNFCAYSQVAQAWLCFVEHMFRSRNGMLIGLLVVAPCP